MRPRLLALVLALALVGCGGHVHEQPTLKQATAGLFPVGVGVDDRVPGRSADWPLLLAQFSFVTPENSLTPACSTSTWPMGSCSSRKRMT
jgi:hypothetical protein